jgi:hypothetical protein
MSNAEASEAARQLAAARWGDARQRTLVAELKSRAAELTPESRRVLAELAAPRSEGDGDGR